MSISRFIVRAARPFVDRFPALANTYRLYRDSRLLHVEPVATPMGFRFIGNESMQNGAFEPDETALIARLLDDAEVFVDVGANIGYYCCLALARHKHTIAFEPIATNLRYLTKNVIANGWRDDIEIFPLALADASGIVDIYGGGTGASLVEGWAGTPGHYVSHVPCSTLDKTIGGRFRGRRVLVVMDVEGAELSALRGGLSLVEQDPKPNWLVEISVGEHQPKGTRVNPNLRQTFDIFWDRGYDAWTATRQPRRVDRPEVDAIVGGGPNTLGTHNYLFLEKGREPPAGA